MLVPGSARQPHKRQNAVSSPIPVNIPGVSGGTTATQRVNSAVSSLLVNTNTANIPSVSVPAIVSGTDIVITTTPLSTSSPLATATPSSTSVAPSNADDISLGTVIATCLGAFVGLLILIITAVWWYKRSGQNIQKRSGGTFPPKRGKSRRLDSWNKLDEKEIDVWQGMVPSPSTTGLIFPVTTDITPQATSSGEKLATMFKKSPSLHSTDKESSESHGAPYFAHSLAQSAEFAKYHPHLAEELAKTVTPMRPNMMRQNLNGPISWDGETIREDDTFVSLRSTRFDSHLTNASEALSPPLVKVINTPTATSSEPHYWESAEVMHYEETDIADSQQVQNPFADVPLDTSKNADNPFFKNQVEISLQRSSNPFADPARVSRNITRTMEEPLDSVYSTDRALRSLIAALDADLSPEEVEQRLRIASMQSTHASIISTGSADYASVEEFPLPPTHAPRSARN